MLPFLIVASLMLTLLGSVIGFRLLIPLKLGQPLLAILWIAAQLMLYLPLIAIVMRRAGSRLPDFLLHMTWILVGLFSLLLVMLLARDLVLVAIKLGEMIVSRFSADGSALALAAKSLGGRQDSLILLSLGTLLTIFGHFNAYDMQRTVEVEVPVKDLHPDLDGLRIAQFSDLHVGSSIGRSHVESVVSQITGLNADLIVFTGDLADGVARDLAPDVEPLKQLKAEHGVYAVTGNHEYYSDPAGWMQLIPQLGLRLLMNESELLSVGEAKLRVGGVPDLGAGRMLPGHAHHPKLAMAGPAADFNLLLAHQPRSAFHAAETACDLMLSGHTHGGQYYPFNWLADKANTYGRGLHRHENMWVYVSMGTGFWGPPVRIGAPPEITLLTLRRI
jgi:predicted MPP superfamily phosphohydrolase